MAPPPSAGHTAAPPPIVHAPPHAGHACTSATAGGLAFTPAAGRSRAPPPPPVVHAPSPPPPVVHAAPPPPPIIHGLPAAATAASRSGAASGRTCASLRWARPAAVPEVEKLEALRLTAWEVVHQLIRALASGGEGAAADLVAKLGLRAETARELAYRLDTLAR